MCIKDDPKMSNWYYIELLKYISFILFLLIKLVLFLWKCRWMKREFTFILLEQVFSYFHYLKIKWNPATRNWTRDHSITIDFYSRTLYQLSYHRRVRKLFTYATLYVKIILFVFILTIVIEMGIAQLWISGYIVRFTRERSRVQSPVAVSIYCHMLER